MLTSLLFPTISCTHVWAGMLMYHVFVCPHVLYAHVLMFGLVCSCNHVWASMLMYSCFVCSCTLGYAHVLMFGLVCSCTHVWAGMLMYSCLGWYAHVSCILCNITNIFATHVCDFIQHANMLMYPCLCWYAHVISIIVFCVWASVLTYKRWPVCPHSICMGLICSCTHVLG